MCGLDQALRGAPKRLPDEQSSGGAPVGTSLVEG
jgi:hypothetical protein